MAKKNTVVKIGKKVVTLGDNNNVVGGASLADDLLRGAAAIAEFIYGHAKHRQKIYKNVPRWPLFYDGQVICARKSKLLERIAELEAAGRSAA